MRQTFSLAALVAVLAATIVLPAAAAEGLQLTPVGRLGFPAKAYVVDLPSSIGIARANVTVRENGAPVSAVEVTPVAASNLRFGSILAIDASESMLGSPYRAALRAATTFIDRRSANQQIGLVFFNARANVVQRPTANAAALHDALSRAPDLAHGTQIYDALAQSLKLLEAAHVSAGSIVLLSDGADTGSRSNLEAIVTQALRNHVRVFTVGLRSKTFDPTSLESLASRTHGGYAEAQSVSELTTIYSNLSGKLASEFVVKYRSLAKTGDHVTVSVAVAGQGRASAEYVAPKPSGLEPFHRSLISRFFLSIGSLVFFSLLAALLVAAAILAVLRRPQGSVVDRIGEFVGIEPGAATQERRQQDDVDAKRHRAHAAAPGSLRAKLAYDFEIGRISLSPNFFLLATLIATVFAFIVLLSISLPLGILAILVPVFAKAWVSSKVKRVRDAFTEQLPDVLQLLASALRSGHSFAGALNVVVGKASEPIRGEFSQVVTDDQIGIPVENSLRRISTRMASRDMEQVALLGELQRTAGGNSAEVLDTVVDTVRERADVRRLARTLTAQGRLARWILTLLPILMGLFMAVAQPRLMHPLVATGGGQTALVIAALMVVAGSFWIKKIVEIDV